MAIRKKHESRDQRRIARGSMKKGFVLRRPAHLGWMITILLSVVAIIALALAWGSHLKAESDAYHQQMELGEWTIEPTILPIVPVSPPAIRAVSIKPEGNVGDILIAGDHGGVIMTLNDGDGKLLYASDIGGRAGLTVASGAISLRQDVERVSRRGLQVIGGFTVTWHTAEDAVTRTYLRGLELALLREYAEAGVDHLLLFGLPSGDDDADGLSVGFLRDLRSLLSDLPEPPAVGVALPLGAFAADGTHTPTDPRADEAAGIPPDTAPLYVGNITPARILNVCDFLAADLRALSPEDTADVLPHIRYAYVRYNLCLLVDKNAPETTEDALSHGFERIFEMEVSPEKEASP